MRTLATALLFVVLSGCSLVQTSRFDPLEYKGFTDYITMTEAARALCGNVGNHQMIMVADGLLMELNHLENYAKYRQRDNTNTLEMIAIIRETTEELRERYKSSETTPSSMYCELKIDAIVDQAALAAVAVQQKVRK